MEKAVDAGKKPDCHTASSQVGHRRAAKPNQ